MKPSDPRPQAPRARRWLALAAALALPAAGLAQETATGTEAAPASATALPTVAGLAGALADPATRDEALLGLAVVARLRPAIAANAPGTSAQAVAALGDNRAWLVALTSAHGPWRAGSPVLDTAAWRVLWLLGQHGLEAGPLARPLIRDLDVYLEQVFDRSHPELAGTLLPALAWQLEADATLLWQEILELARADPALAEALASADLFEGWEAAEGPVPPGPAEITLEQALRSLDVMVRDVVGTGPPDHRRLQDFRHGLLALMPELEPGGRLLAQNLLHLAGLVDGLHQQRFTRFAGGLLAVLADLDRSARELDEPVQALGAWLARTLPVVSNTYARAFADVDPRLNSVIAAAYDVSLKLGRGTEPHEPGANRAQLADAVAKLALLIPDMAFYFDLPVRDPIAGSVDACTGLVARRDPDGSSSLTRQLFDDCLETLVDLADDEARQAQLAGDAGGPFGDAYLQRELSLTPGQRINYGIGYLHHRFATGCQPPARPLPNPLEWAYLATFTTWLAEQAPVYFQAPENERRLARMREIGFRLMRATAEQVDCIAGAGAGVNDPVIRVLGEYRDQLATLDRGLRRAEVAFRTQNLAAGADIALERGAGQNTAYRPDNLAIGPCEAAEVCEMSGTLSSTRALLGLFPEPYLVADQSGLGRVEICYEKMEWVDRRAEPVREGDANVANYFGRLAFDLKGRFVEDGQVTDLFAFRFRSPQEYHYMFAAAKEEVLADACPVEWFGSRIVTPLPAGKLRIVPDRLTYLSAPRTLPSRLLSLNWDRGAEWRDWFVTGIGVSNIPLPPAEGLGPRLERHLQNLYRREQDVIYGAMLRGGRSPAQAGVESLFQEVSRLSTDKSLVRMQMMLFYPRMMIQSDGLRRAMVGHGGLLDTLVLNRFREENVPVAQVMDIAYRRLDEFQDGWRRVPERTRRTGSLSISVAQAQARLGSLYRRYFAPAPRAQASSPDVAASGQE